MTEDREQRTDGRGQRTEDRGQMTEGRGQKTENRGQMAEGRGQRTEGRVSRFRIDKDYKAKRNAAQMIDHVFSVYRLTP